MVYPKGLKTSLPPSTTSTNGPPPPSTDIEPRLSAPQGGILQHGQDSALFGFADNNFYGLLWDLGGDLAIGAAVTLFRFNPGGAPVRVADGAAGDGDLLVHFRLIVGAQYFVQLGNVAGRLGGFILWQFRRD